MPSTAKTLAERLWPRLRKSPDSGCWLWTGPVPEYHDRFPIYPSVCVPPAERELSGGRKSVGAHRAAWLLTHGPIPDGMQVCHTCDVTTCANPAHLWLGTASENALDCARKGRKGQTRQTREMLADMPRRLADAERSALMLAASPGACGVPATRCSRARRPRGPEGSMKPPRLVLAGIIRGGKARLYPVARP
jgi:hypothetical protein